MADNTGENAKRNIKEINEIVSAIDSGFKSITYKLEDVTEAISDANSEARVFDNIVKDVGRSINKLSRQNESLINNQVKLNQGLLTSKKVRQQINEIEATRNILASRLKTLQDQQLEGLILTEEHKQQIVQLEKELAQQSQDVTLQYEDQLKKIQKIETKLGIFSRLTKGLTKIPLIGDLLDAEGALAAMNKSALDGKSLFKNLGAGISAAFSGIEKASVILAVVNAIRKVLVFIKDIMFAADERITNIAKNLSVSKTEAEGIYKNLTGLNLNSTLATTKNIAEAFNEIAQYSEITLIASNSQLKTQVELTKELGIASESALSLQESLMVSNIDAEKGVDLIYDQVAAFSNQNKVLVDGRKILEQVGKTSKLIQLNFKGNIPLLTKTILEANKLGLSLDQVDKIAGSLLDFESSISSELEAELLTGKQLNLEKARLYALNNDIAGLTEEIAKQGITAANFASMNRIQQEAIAKTLGMSSSELGDSLFKSERINKQAKETIRLLRERGAVEQANALEQGILSGKSLEDAQKSLDIQTKFNAAIERFQQIFSDVFTGERLDKMATYLEKLARALEGGQSLFSALAFGPNEDKKTAYARVSGGMGPKFATGGIVTKPITNATVGEAGPEAIVPLSTLMNEFREMKSLLSQLVNKEGAVYLDSSKVGTAMAMGTYKVQ